MNKQVEMIKDEAARLESVYRQKLRRMSNKDSLGKYRQVQAAQMAYAHILDFIADLPEE